MICGVALPLLLEATGDGGWPLAWQGMGLVSLLMTAASLWAVRAVGEPGGAVAATRWGVELRARTMARSEIMMRSP